MVAAAGSGGLAVVLGLGGRHAGPGWELASLLVTLAYPLLLLVSVAHALGRGRAGGPLAGGPLLVLLAGLPGIGVVRRTDAALHDRRFATALPQVEALLMRVPLGSGERVRISVDSLPPAVRACCARLVVARRDSTGAFSATIMGQRNVGYLYDPSGRRLERGLHTGRWRSHATLARDWYRVTRF